LLNMRDIIPGLAWATEPLTGLSSRRTLPRWRRDVFDDSRAPVGTRGAPEVVLFADTFNRYFERENLDAALAVLNAAGYRVHFVKPADGSSRPLCCGRTFLSVGKVDEARREA
jgi:Fe-S oxidoreductase